MANGFDKYLEYQLNWAGGFYTKLFQAIELADEDNLAKLAKGFPEEVEAYKLWSRKGLQTLLEKCSPDHPLMQKIEAGEAIL